MSVWDSKPREMVKSAIAGADTDDALPAASLVGSLRRTDQAECAADAARLPNHRHRRWFDLVWIVYSAFFFIEPFERHNRNHWIQFGVVYAIFVGLYLGIIYARSRRMAYASLAGLGLLALLYYPSNVSASGMFIYVVAFAPFITESLTVCISIFVAVSFSLMGEGFYLHLSPWAWGFPLFLALAVGAANVIAAQRMRANQRLHLAHEEITHLAKMAERERIARDLHDVLGHTLSVVVLKSELAGKLLSQNPERARKEIAEVEQIARTALGEVREAIRGYRTEGLAAELEHARATLDAAGVSLTCSPAPKGLRPAEETVLALIVREAVTNIVRHAQASRCSINVEKDEARTKLTIEDDGRGSIRQEGNGLRGMRERAEALGGSVDINSERGTRIVISFPI